MPELLTEPKILAALESLPGWERSGSELRRTFQAPAFLDGIRLVEQVAEYAESVNHHPDIDIRWRKVTFSCSTHSEGGLTEFDVALAGKISELFGAL